MYNINHSSNHCLPESFFGHFDFIIYFMCFLLDTLVSKFKN